MRCCYTVELVDECNSPMMRSVPCAYILTMHETETFPWLHGVASRTYVQRNRGFRNCEKPCGAQAAIDSVGPTGPTGPGARVDVSFKDLTHAYKSLFDRIDATGEAGEAAEAAEAGEAGEAGDAAAPVLVFEDDARLVSTARADLAEVDAFIARSAFCVYTLGSCGLMLPYEPSLMHWMFLQCFFCFTHACVYSARARRAVRAIDACAAGHFDNKVINQLPVKLTFYRPIAYQPLTESENSKAWCVKCDGGAEDVAHRAVARALIRLMRFDTHPASAIGGAYELQRVFLIAPVVAVAVLIVVTMLVDLKARGSR